MPNRHKSTDPYDESLVMVESPFNNKDTNTVREPAPRTKLLKSFCWCQKEQVMVPAVDLRAGRTIPCHRQDCEAPGGEQ